FRSGTAEREGKPEHRPYFGKLGPGVSAKRLDRFAHDAEPQPGTLGARHRGMRAEETLEQALALVQRNAQSVVAHLDDQTSRRSRVVALHPPDDVDPPVRFGDIRILDRVRD